MAGTRDPRGSLWHRWDPHIHAPGTILNDQYRGSDPWDDFLRRIESSAPPIRALGITDYYSLDVYEQVLQWKAKGRLADVSLIFPNIEMRYGIGSGRGSPINLHLLVSPEDPDHVENTRRFLRSLTFQAHDESFRCTRDDLIRLGRAHNKATRDAEAALGEGANQFKVNPDQLREEWKKSGWIRENALIAVPASSNDGSAGLQGDASLAALRKEIERAAHVIFSSQEAVRKFWLGQGAATFEQLNTDWNGCKPCLHGSDAHDATKVGAPDLQRLCWIKGDLTFETLRHACLEPEARTFIGQAPPRGALPSQTVSSVSVTNAPWLKTSSVPLNAGLVGIIGARGSGKTALADIIAAGGHALLPHLNERSFIHRAKKHLGDSEAGLTWEDGDPTANALSQTELEDFMEPRVQYLSQQFVDALCSAEGVTDELLAEIERVIFQAHPVEDRMGATNFQDLLDIRAARGRAMRRNYKNALEDTAHELNAERDRRSSLSGLQQQRPQLVTSIDKDKRDRTSLLVKGGEERATRLDLVSAAAERVRLEIEQVRRRKQAVIGLRDEVADQRKNKSPSRVRQLQQTYADAGLSSENWKAFTLEFSGLVDGILSEAIRQADARIRSLSGPALGEPDLKPDAPPSATPLIAEDAALDRQTLSLLDK